MGFLSRLNALSNSRAVMIGFVIAAFYYFALFDDGDKQKAAITSAQTEMNNLEKETKDIEMNYQRAMRYQEFVHSMGNSFQGLMEYLPAKMNVSDLMRAISSEAKASGVNINRVKEGTGQDEKGAFYDSLRVEVELNGTFPQHLLFLSYLTRLPQIMMVDTMSMSVTGRFEAGTSPMVNMNAVVAGYRYVSELDKPPDKKKGPGKK